LTKPIKPDIAKRASYGRIEELPYICAVVHLFDRMILAYRIGSEMTTSLVTDTIRDALQKRRSLMDSHFTATGDLIHFQRLFDLVALYHTNPSMFLRMPI